MEHASLQTFGARHVPPGEADHLAQIGAASQAGKGKPASGPFLSVETPERRGAALEDLDADGVLARGPLAHAHHGDRGGEAAGVRGDAVEDGLPGPHRCTPLPHQARLLCHPHPTEVTEGQEAHLLQGLLIGETQQDGDQTGDCTSPQ